MYSGSALCPKVNPGSALPAGFLKHPSTMAPFTPQSHSFLFFLIQLKSLGIMISTALTNNPNLVLWAHHLAKNEPSRNQIVHLLWTHTPTQMCNATGSHTAKLTGFTRIHQSGPERVLLPTMSLQGTHSPHHHDYFQLSQSSSKLPHPLDLFCDSMGKIFFNWTKLNQKRGTPLISLPNLPTYVPLLMKAISLLSKPMSPLRLDPSHQNWTCLSWRLVAAVDIMSFRPSALNVEVKNLACLSASPTKNTRVHTLPHLSRGDFPRVLVPS